MAGDWIKMRTDLYRHPKVCVIADKLIDPDGDLARYVNQNKQRDMTVTRNVMRNVTVGALVTVWGVMRHRGSRLGNHLFVKNIGLTVIDDICDLPGFGEAMVFCEWAVETDDGVVFPNFFEEFNVEPGKDAQERNAERQRKYREKRNALRNVTVTSQNNAREEREREKENTGEVSPVTPQATRRKRIPVTADEILKELAIPPELSSEAGARAVRDWLEHKDRIRAQYASAKSFAVELARWAKIGPDRFAAAVAFSIGKEWKGIYEEQVTAGRSREKTDPPQESVADLMKRAKAIQL